MQKLDRKKWGTEIEYPVEGLEETITCYTTRPDTNFGATFVVLCSRAWIPQKHLDLLPKKLKSRNIDKNPPKIRYWSYDRRTEKDRNLTGLYVTNRLNNKKLPLYVGDFVLAHVEQEQWLAFRDMICVTLNFPQEMGIDVIRCRDITRRRHVSYYQTRTEYKKLQEQWSIASFRRTSILEAKEKIMEYLVEKNRGTRK